MADVSSLHCPNCGAAVAPDAARCPYCRARLATVSCPSCFALMFEGAAFCPSCGARRQRHEAEPADIACPSCKGALQRILIGATPIRECSRCDGVWLDADTFERICAEREVRAGVLYRFRPQSRGTAARPVHYRPCPRCGKLMNRMNFGRLSGTVIDVCRGHGAFLDAGELHEITAFIDAGGLERARQREIDDLREEQHRLAQLVAEHGKHHHESAIPRRSDEQLLLALWKSIAGNK